MKKTHFAEENIFNRNSSDNKEILITILFIGSIFIGIMFPMILPFIKYGIIPLLMIGAYKYDVFDYMVFPLTFLDNPIGTLIFGKITIIWVYFLLVGCKFLLVGLRERFGKTVRINSKTLLLLILLIYFTLSIKTSGMESVKTIIIILITFQLSNKISKYPEKLDMFLLMVILSATICAISMTFELAGTVGDLDRAAGIGLKDPNYTSYIVNMGLCAILYYLPFKKMNVLRLSMIIIFGLGIIRSGSRLGIIVFLFILFLNYIFTCGFIKKVKYVLVCTIVVCIFCLIIVPRIDLDLRNNLTYRFVSTYEDFINHDFDAATADRTAISRIYLNTYINQPPFKILFGGNNVGSPELLIKVNLSVAHNTYIDYLMGLGLIGGMIVVVSHILSIRRNYRKRKANGYEQYNSIVMMQVSSLIIAMGLSMMQVNLWWIVWLL